MKKRILIAPLNWGLGHATRCIPLIHALLENHFIPIIASDGAPRGLLKKEFPDLENVALPSYHITYTKSGRYFKYKLLWDAPKILTAIQAEQHTTRELVKKYQISGIISDNRYGVYDKNVPSVFMTHQLQVMSGTTTWFSTKMQQQLLTPFSQYWVPDVEGLPNLSGALGHPANTVKNVKYIGALSRFHPSPRPIIYQVMVLLSGPEPQRTILENILMNALKNYGAPVLLVRGVIEDVQCVRQLDHLTIYNFMTSEMLEKSLNQSLIIIARSGYSTIMDLAKLRKKAFFIPTPGQYEQEYLARTLMKNNCAPYCAQKDFSIEKLKDIDNFVGLDAVEHPDSLSSAFELFKGK